MGLKRGGKGPDAISMTVSSDTHLTSVLNPRYRRLSQRLTTQFTSTSMIISSVQWSALNWFSCLVFLAITSTAATGSYMWYDLLTVTSFVYVSDDWDPDGFSTG